MPYEGQATRMIEHSRKARWLRWGGKAVASLLDQALFSGTHFFLNITLARWLSVYDYGVFALVYALMVFCNAIHLSFVAEPSVVLWSKNKDRQRAFLSDIFFFNALFSILLIVIAILAIAVLSALGLVNFLDAVLTLSSAFTLPMFWLLRQIAYAEMRPWRAVVQTLIYGLSVVCGAFVLNQRAMISVESAVGLLAAGALLAGGCGLLIYRPRLSFELKISSIGALRECLIYGRWSAPSGIAIWVANNIFILTLPFLSGVESAARLKAFLNFLLPFQQVLIGLSLVALPAFAREFMSKDRARAQVLIRWSFAIAGVGSLIYSTLLFLGADSAYATIYGSKYSQSGDLTLYGLMLPIIWAIIAVARTVLRAKQVPRAVFSAYAWTLGTVGIVSVPLGSLAGPEGALVGTTIMHGGVALLMLAYIRQRERRPNEI